MMRNKEKTVFDNTWAGCAFAGGDGFSVQKPGVRE